MVYHVQEPWSIKNYAVKLVGTKPLGKENEGTLKKLVSSKKKAYHVDDALYNQVEASARRNDSITAYKTTEVQSHIKVVKGGHPNIVNLLAFANNGNLAGGHGHMLFFEPCNGGDLHGLIGQFYRRYFVVSEFFVWKVFESLLRAVAWLHKEHESDDNDPQLDSRPVLIHGDINPPNVMLSFEGEATWPTVKLGDLDAALPLWDDSKEVEFPFGKDESNPPEYPVRSTKGDIWGIGATIHTLCHQGFAPLTKSPPPHASPVGESRDGCQMYELTPHYSQQLETFVGYCLEMDPGQRWSASALLERVTAHIDESKMREEPRAAPEWLRMEPKEKLNGLTLNPTPEGSSEEEEGEEEAVAAAGEEIAQLPDLGEDVGITAEPEAAVDPPTNEKPPKWGGSDSSDEGSSTAPGSYNPKKRAFPSEEPNRGSSLTFEGFSPSTEDVSDKPPRKKARTRAPTQVPARERLARPAKAEAARKILDMGRKKRGK